MVHTCRATEKTRVMAEPEAKLRLRYPEYLGSSREQDRAHVEATFRASGFDYDFAFPGAEFALLNGYWIDLLIQPAAAGAAGAAGGALTILAWKRVGVVLRQLHKHFRQGQLNIEAPDTHGVVSYKLPEGDAYEAAGDAIPADYEKRTEDMYTVLHWSPDGEHWEVEWRHTETEKRPG